MACNMHFDAGVKRHEQSIPWLKPLYSTLFDAQHTMKQAIFVS